MKSNDKKHEPRSYWLTSAAWAPEGRLVAYETYMHIPESGPHPIHVREVVPEIDKAIENLAHAVSACNYAEGTYLLEAARELVELVYGKK